MFHKMKRERSLVVALFTMSSLFLILTAYQNCGRSLTALSSSGSTSESLCDGDGECSSVDGDGNETPQPPDGTEDEVKDPDPIENPGDGDVPEPPISPDDPPVPPPGNDTQTPSANQWIQVPITTQAMKNRGRGGGEGFQLIWDIEYAPSNPSTVYMIVDTTQVWKSIDGGTSWQPKHRGFYANGGASIGVDPTNENIVFAAGEQMGHWASLSGNRDGIYRTLDGGEHWQLVKPAGSGRYSRYDAGDLFAFPSKNVIYAAIFGMGLLRSGDNGNNWTTIVPHSTTGNIYDIKLHPTDRSVLFVSGRNGYKKVTDLDGSFTVSNLGLTTSSQPMITVINKNDPKIIHAINGDRNIYRSINGGTSFSIVFTNSNSSKKTKRLVISPVDPNIMFVSFGEKTYRKNEEFFFTHDGGNTWHVPDSMDEKDPMTGDYVSGFLVGWDFDAGGAFIKAPIAAHPTNKNIALTLGAPDHVAKTIDGGLNWRRSNSGFTGGAAILGYSRIVFDKSNAKRFALGLTDMGGFLTEDGGETFRNFKALSHGNQQACHAVALDPTVGSKVIIAACGHNYSGQILQVSRDNGHSWAKITSPDTEGLYKFAAFSPTNGNVIYAARYSKVVPDVSDRDRDGNTSELRMDYIPDSFISTDKGVSWSRVTRNGSNVEVKVVFPKNGDIVYTTSGGTIYKSLDRGQTWKAPYPSLNVSNEGIAQLAVDPNDQDRLYAAVSGYGVYIVTPDKADLKNHIHGIMKPYFDLYKTSWTAVDPNNSNNIYVASWTGAWGHTDEAIYRSTDRGQTWQNITFNLAPINVGSLAVNPHDSFVYIGSFHGTWKLAPLL